MRYILLLLLLGAISTAIAATPLITPKEGKWEITTQMPSAKMPSMANLPPEAIAQMKKHGMSVDGKSGSMTVAICLNKANLQKWQAMGDKQKATTGHKCDEPKSVLSGNKLTLDMHCTKPSSTIHSVYEFSPNRDSYTFDQTVKVEGQPEHRITGKSRRVGDC